MHCLRRLSPLELTQPFMSEESPHPFICHSLACAHNVNVIYFIANNCRACPL